MKGLNKVLSRTELPKPLDRNLSARKRKVLDPNFKVEKYVDAIRVEE